MDANVAVVNNQTTVSFYNDSLTAIIDSGGEIWTVMNEILRNIGFDATKVENQRKAWSKDILIERWSKKIPLLYQGVMRETICINRRCIPIALAKISITPTMQRTQPEIVEKLIRYQEECADVLYRHFYPREICKNTTTPISREEMALYMAALQSQTEEVKKMCMETFSSIYRIIEKNSDENKKSIAAISDVISRFCNSYESNSGKIVECLNNMKNSSVNNEDTAEKKEEEKFCNTTKNLISKICSLYNIEAKTAYTLVYGKMVEIDGIVPYKYKTESSVIKSISKNKECRESFIKCANILNNYKMNNISQVDISSRKKKINHLANSKPLWTTPEEIKSCILAYQNKYNKNTYQYASQCLYNDICKKSGLMDIKELRKRANEYGSSLGYNSCSIAYYIYNNKDLFNIMKSIVEEV